jgi:hypothetical protein
MKGFQSIKEILRDESLHICLAQVKKLHLASDRSFLKVTVLVFPEQRNIIATMAWDAVGPDSGDIVFPAVDDMVLVAQANGDDDQAYVIKRLSSRLDKIPEIAADGSKVQRTLPGKKFWNISDTRINLSRALTEPTENLVLGQVFKAMMSSLLASLKLNAQNDADHLHIGNLGYYTFKPNIETEFLNRKDEYDTLKTSPIDDEVVLSDLSFTEK